MISAQQVKELREATGAGMMDCKKALVETNGDMDKAVDYLREKGLAAAAKTSTACLRAAVAQDPAQCRRCVRGQCAGGDPAMPTV